jgi:hypothetical protein
MELRAASHSNYIPLEPLVSYNIQRVFRDAYEGIQDYMGTRVSHDYNNAWLGAVLVILPDYRIRIREIVHNEEQVKVKFEMRKVAEDVRVHCLIGSAVGRQEIFATISESEALIPLNSRFEQFDSF